MKERLKKKKRKMGRDNGGGRKREEGMKDEREFIFIF